MSRAITIASFLFSLALHGAALLMDSRDQGPVIVQSNSGPRDSVSVKLASKPRPQKSIAPKNNPLQPIAQTIEIPLEMSEDFNDDSEQLAQEIDDAPTLFSPQPQYPRIAQLRGHEGFVRVRLSINGQGKPLSAELLESSGYQSLDQAALKGLMLWRFHATHGSEALGYWTEKVVEFRLQ